MLRSDDVGVELDAAIIKEAGEPVPMIQAVTDGFCDQGLAALRRAER
jgi:hypothetical protein